MVKKASTKGKLAKQDLMRGDKDYSMGVKTWKVGVTDSEYAKVGNLTPADIRAINIKKANAILQEKWAQEWLEGIKQIKSSQKEIEKIRCDIEKLHFKTEAEIDEYVLGGLLAKTEYDAHFREWTARKNQETKFINGGANEEIRVVAAEFADRLRIRKAKNDRRIQDSKAKTEAQISQLGEAKAKTEAETIERKRKAFEAFMNGDDMEIVEAIGGGVSNGEVRSDVKILDSLISGTLFNFK